MPSRSDPDESAPRYFTRRVTARLQAASTLAGELVGAVSVLGFSIAQGAAEAIAAEDDLLRQGGDMTEGQGVSHGRSGRTTSGESGSNSTDAEPAHALEDSPPASIASPHAAQAWRPPSFGQARAPSRSRSPPAPPTPATPPPVAAEPSRLAGPSLSPPLPASSSSLSPLPPSPARTGQRRARSESSASSAASSSRPSSVEPGLELTTKQRRSRRKRARKKQKKTEAVLAGGTAPKTDRRRAKDRERRAERRARREVGLGWRPPKAFHERHPAPAEDKTEVDARTDLPMSVDGWLAAPMAYGKRADEAKVIRGEWKGATKFPVVEHRIYTADELVNKFNFEYVEWDGIQPRVLLDEEGRIFGALPGRPANDPTWEASTQRAAARIRERASRVGPSKEATHRRGKFAALNHGISFAQTMRGPGNLRNSERDQEVLEELTADADIKRIAGFHSSAFGMWFPKVFMFVATLLASLMAYYPWLRMPFACSIFACVTFNFGPRAVCFNHRDYGNAPGVPCAITPLGSYDPKRGGHLILFDYLLVIEFPPGSTAEILSGCVHHGNTPISPGEHRCAIISYMAGGLARDVAYSFRPSKELDAAETEAIRANSPSRLAAIVERFSTMKTIVADRALLRQLARQ